MTDKDFPYADILHLPHHRAAGRAHMSLHDRAAQFAPFAALTGFDGVIAETGRQTERRVELSESEKARLDRKFARIIESLQQGQHPTVTVVYFEADARKEGGAHRQHSGEVKKIDLFERTMVFMGENSRSGGKAVSLDDVVDIRGKSLEALEDACEGDDAF